MLIRRWQPFGELKSMETELDREWNRAFRPFHARPRFWAVDGRVNIDVFWAGESLTVRASLPGVKPEDVEVIVTDDTLTIKGETKLEKEVKEEEYLHREHRHGAFRRAVALPHNLDTEKADASYENGILTVTIPKVEESKSKSLKINVKALEGEKS